MMVFLISERRTIIHSSLYLFVTGGRSLNGSILMFYSKVQCIQEEVKQPGHVLF